MSYVHVEDAVEASHKALAAIINGDLAPWLELYSEADDISLGNPFGPFAVGRQAMVEAGSRAAGHYTGGKILGFDRIGTHISSDLACVVEVERFEAKLDRAAELTSLRLRVTSVYRREPTGWKLLHRHADPINTIRTAESLSSR
jgi:ketosteroid isomerase-like protein